MSRINEALKKAAQERSSEVVAFAPTTEVQPEGFEQVTLLKPAPPVNARLVTLREEQSVSTEKFRVLSTRLMHLQTQRPLKTVLITSCVPGEGKSFVAANLAVTLARGQNQKVLLLVGDLRQPGLSSIFGFQKLPGLAEYLQEGADLTGLLCRLEGMPLWFLPAGNSPQPPTDLLQSDRLAELIARIAGSFDWVLVDSPPMVPWADANIWARLTDGILLVVRKNKTPKALLAKALESLNDPSILGVVFNQDRERACAYDSYHEKYAMQQKNGKGGNGLGKY
jgi:capsular exopolysaccharide synthesis family protein